MLQDPLFSPICRSILAQDAPHSAVFHSPCHSVCFRVPRTHYLLFCSRFILSNHLKSVGGQAASFPSLQLDSQRRNITHSRLPNNNCFPKLKVHISRTVLRQYFPHIFPLNELLCKVYNIKFLLLRLNIIQKQLFNISKLRKL